MRSSSNIQEPLRSQTYFTPYQPSPLPFPVIYVDSCIVEARPVIFISAISNRVTTLIPAECRRLQKSAIVELSEHEFFRKTF